jgi:hypothetical protein
VHGGGIITAVSDPAVVTNCIIWGNFPDQIAADPLFPMTLTATYSDVQDGFPGQGNIDGDPLFVDVASDDYHLSICSPAIDAGDPSSDFSNEPEPNGGRINMGAYGNTPEATITVTEPDSDEDGSIDDCDPCPFDAENDIDNDGVCGDVDNCPYTDNPGQADCDEDGVGNACELDDDNDRLPDEMETIEGTDPCNPDSDGDGILDGPDQCKLEDASGFDADLNGCIDNVHDLTDMINTLPDDVLSDETKNSLISKIEAAENSIDKEKDQAAINQLGAFINEVNAQRGNKISEEVADMLIQYALNIIAQIEAG